MHRHGNKVNYAEHLFSVSQMQQRYSCIDWPFLLTDIFKHNFSSDDEIYVLYPDYMTKLNDLILKTSPGWVDYSLLTLYYFDVLRELVDLSVHANREEFCLEATKLAFVDVLSNMYLNLLEPDRLKHIETHMKANIDLYKQVIEKKLRKLKHIPKKIRKFLIRKILSVDLLTDRYQHTFNMTKYEELNREINMTENFFENVISFYSLIWKVVPKLFEETPTPELIAAAKMPLYTVNAGYIPESKIVFPEPLFHRPLYWGDTPECLNLGSLGVVLGHEMFHSIDFNGIRFIENGTFTKEMDDWQGGAFRRAVACYQDVIRRKFSSELELVSSVLRVEIDTGATRNEDFADLAGLWVSYEAYKKKARGHAQRVLPGLSLTPLQLFFVSMAQPYCTAYSTLTKLALIESDEHSLPNVRVNARVMMFPEFKAAFNCSDSSRMVSNETCPIL